MPPFDLFFVLFLTFPVFAWLMDGVCSDPVRGWISRLAGGFSLGWWFGFGYFLAGLWWTGHALIVEREFIAFMPFAVLGLPAGLALFWGLAGAMARLFWREDWRRPLVLAVAFALAEYLRGTVLTGFPWNALGHAAMTHPLTMQKASVLGLWGVTLIAVAIFASPALLAPRIGAGQWRPLLVALALGLADLAFGAWRLAAHPPQYVEGVSLRLVQPAIEQSEKWSPELEDRHFRLLMDLSTSPGTGDKAGLAGTDLLVWPETAFPFVLTERRDALSALGAMIPPGTTLAAGAIRVEPRSPGQERELYFNSVVTIDEQGEITGAADKLHLVPFGEYLPLEDLARQFGLSNLVRIEGGLEPGAGRVLLEAGEAGRFLPLICYEIIFPGEATAGSQGVDFILNVTNDAWFGSTPGPWQHWRQAVLRGVEAGMPVVRSANNGISSVTDPMGRVVASIGHGERAVLDSKLPARVEETLYLRFGNTIYWMLVLVFLLTVLLRRTAAPVARH